MTCIVGISKGDTVYLGGDSAAMDSNLNRIIIKDPKVFVRGRLGFGVCGLPKIMDVLAHAMEFPEQEKGMSDRSFLVDRLVPVIRDGLKRLDCTYTHPEYGTCFQGAILLAYDGKLYTLEPNFQLTVSSTGYASVGSGSQLALGSLQMTRHMFSPRRRILSALKAACTNAGVAPPFVVVTVKGR